MVTIKKTLWYSDRNNWYLDNNGSKIQRKTKKYVSENWKPFEHKTAS